jgi:hypothetical protein
MDGNRQHGQELVALSTAAAFVYEEIMGITIERMEVPQLDQILHDEAHALSHVAPIYGAISATEMAKPHARGRHDSQSFGSEVRAGQRAQEQTELVTRRAGRPCRAGGHHGSLLCPPVFEG